MNVVLPGATGAVGGEALGRAMAREAANPAGGGVAILYRDDFKRLAGARR